MILLVAACRGRSEDAPKQAAPAPVPVAVVAPVADEAQAMAAYDAKDWPRCVQIFTAIADAAAGQKQRDALYGAACCHALDGKIEQAFAALGPATAKMVEREVAHLETDHDLDALHADPRWTALVAAAKQRLADRTASLVDPTLRLELLAMYAEDQAALKSGKADMQDPKVMAEVKALTHRHTARMKEVVAKYGWPGASIVGEDGANAAWLLVQHADDDLAFQKLCLANMDPLVATEEVSVIDHAYLYDRVAVNEHRLQRFGTQFDARREPQPMEDPANVDARRKAIGLPSMAEYRQSMLTMYGAPK